MVKCYIRGYSNGISSFFVELKREGSGSKMKIAVTGLTGFIGSHLKIFLTEMGHQVIGISRKDFSEEGMSGLTDKLRGCNAVINLAGAPINGRWNRRRKEAILTSRVETTRKLTEAINRLPHLPEVFISTSAIGFYPSSGICDENTGAAQNSFLSQVCQQWEAAARKVNPAVRLVILRFGLILGAAGGVLPKIMTPSKWGISVIFGTGHQPFSWIHIDDLMQVFKRMLYDKQLSGVFNCVAPDTLTWLDLMSEVDMHFEPFWRVHMPEWLLRLFLLEGASLLTGGQQVIPLRLQEHNFTYQYPELKDAITDLAKKFNGK